MILLRTHVIISLLSYIFCQTENTIQYYDNLITTNIEQSQNYKFPTIAEEFQGNYYTSEKSEFLGQYDFIIVGTGSTGGVLTGRLSEKNDWKILAIEAGTWENNFTDIPSMSVYSFSSKYNWGFRSTPQTTACLAMENQVCLFPRGKGVGGSTLLNAGVYSRGSAKQFDIWNSLVDQGNWTYENVLQYFKKSENSHIDGDAGYHGFNGPLDVNYHIPSSIQLLAYLKASEELGMKVLDYNGKSMFGVSRTQFNYRDGRRLSTGKAFVQPALHRSNLKVLTNTYVTKLIYGIFNKVKGVEFMNNGKRSYATVKKEVILSAGVFGSPTILMHSGIGPKKDLQNKKITLIKDLPVGHNLQDHATYFGLYFNTNYTEPIESLREYIKEYLNGVGPLTISANLQGIGFLETKYAKVRGVPDIELLLIPSNSSGSLLVQTLNINQNNYDAAFKNINSTTDYAILIVLLQPRSFGNISLNSNNVFDYPIINPNFLSDYANLDIRTMYEAIKIVINMLDTNAFRKINATLAKVVFPECEKFVYLSEEFWECKVRQFTINIYHPSGTCKMGRFNDNAVVDGEFKVHGVKYLRVADVSVFPFATSGHPSAPAMMMGEKLADMLKTKYS